MSALRERRAPPLAIGLAVAICSLVAGVAVTHLPVLALLVVPLIGLALWMGSEILIVLAWLASFGLVPFVTPEQPLGSRLTLWLVMFCVACALMLFAWAGRELAGRPSHRIAVTPLLALTFVLLAYTLARLSSGSPASVPSLAAPFVMFPVAALVTALWLSHPEAVAGLKRTWPVVLALMLVWCGSYVLGSAGSCSVCRRLVGTGLEATDVLGSSTRLFTDGQNALLALVVVGIALALHRFTPARAALVALGLAAIALQASRAQYAGILAAAALLVAWRARWSSPGARIAIVGLAALAVVALVSSPVGARGLSAVSEVRQGAGNGGYRLELVAQQREHWSAFGTSVSLAQVGQVNFDLGIPNTIVVLGWVGAVLEVGVILLAVLRGLRTRSMAGWIVAAGGVLLLVTRFSLPLLESYYSAAAFGLLIGLAIALPAPLRRGSGSPA